MATFSTTGFKSLNYNSFRPRYPQSFYKLLVDYAGAKPGFKFNRTLDVGCGTGIATYDMLNISNKVEGMDLSPNMVKTAESLIEERCKSLDVSSSRISFITADLDNLESFKDRQGYDLIVAAQCLHWTKDFDKLFANVHQLLNPGGIFAYWYYVDPVIVNYHPTKGDRINTLKNAHAVYLKYCYGPDHVGPYWEQPGRTIIRDFYKVINDKIPKTFGDVVINNYQVDINNYTPPSSKDLVLVKENITIKDSLNYISTYSGVHSYIEAHPETNLIEDYAQELKEKTGWDDSTTFDYVWNTGYTFIRK